VPDKRDFSPLIEEIANPFVELLLECVLQFVFEVAGGLLAVIF